MTDCFILATDGGMVLAERNGGQSEGRLAGWKLAARSLADRKATAVIAREGVILAGTTDGVFRSDDGGQTWEEASDGLRIRHVRWLAYHPDVSDFEVAGTEPAGIFISHGGGTRWQGHPEVEELRDRFKWFLPYSPEAGCVRGFAFHGDRAYAAVEVGGVLRSDDAGATWRLAGGSTGEPVFDIPPSPRVHADVHSVAGHPSSADRVIGATAEGLYRSADAGDTWEASHVGSYCRAVWVDPEDAEHMILGPADSVSRKNGRIEETRDAGATWSRASEGLDLPWPDRMVERFVQVDGNLLAVTSDGRLYEAPLDGLQWRNVLPDLRDIHAVALVR